MDTVRPSPFTLHPSPFSVRVSPDLCRVPFLDGGRDPRVGLDCWGLVMIVQKRMFGRIVPDYGLHSFQLGEISEAIMLAEASGWLRVVSPKPGDVAAMAFDDLHPDDVQHFGTYLEAGAILHTRRRRGVCAHPASHPALDGKIKGFFRWVKGEM